MQDFDVIPFPGGKKKEDLISTHCSVHVCLHWMQNAHTGLNKSLGGRNQICLPNNYSNYRCSPGMKVGVQMK